jgi:hypothetical protein
MPRPLTVRRAHLKDEEAANPLRDLNLQLSRTKCAIADMAMGGGDLDAIQKSWDDAFAKLQTRQQKDKSNVVWVEDMADWCLQFGQQSLSHQRIAQAKKSFEVGEKLLAAKEGLLDPIGSRLLQQLRQEVQNQPVTTGSAF